MAEKIKLTKTLVEALPFTASSNQRVDYGDTDMAGLYLRVGLNSKTYYLIKRDPLTKQVVKVKLGAHPAMLPADARSKVVKLLGNDAGIRVAKSAVEHGTLAKLWETYLQMYAPDHLKASSLASYEWIWSKHIEPRWGKRDPKSLTRAEVRAYFEEYSKQSKAQANKLLTVLSSLYTWAGKREMVDFNPASMIEPHATVRRTRRADKGAFTALAEKLDSLPPLYANVYWLLLLLGQRRTETCGMRWQDIDFKEKVWTIPGDDIMGVKLGLTKNGLTHTVPLPPMALSKIEAMRPHTGDKVYVFHCAGQAWNKKVESFVQPPTITQFIAKLFAKGQMGDIAKFSPHDLRRTAFTNMTSLTEDQAIVKRVVNHIDKSSAAMHYDYHHYNGVKRKALLAWEKRLRGYIAGGEALTVAEAETEEAV